MLQSDAVSVSQDDIPQSNPEEPWRALNMKAPIVYSVKTIVLVQWNWLTAMRASSLERPKKLLAAAKFPFVSFSFAHALTPSILINGMTSGRVQHESHIPTVRRTLYCLPLKPPEIGLWFIKHRMTLLYDLFLTCSLFICFADYLGGEFLVVSRMESNSGQEAFSHFFSETVEQPAGWPESCP